MGEGSEGGWERGMEEARGVYHIVLVRVKHEMHKIKPRGSANIKLILNAVLTANQIAALSHAEIITISC